MKFFADKVCINVHVCENEEVKETESFLQVVEIKHKNPGGYDVSIYVLLILDCSVGVRLEI
jgi:hypothetical protein